MKATIEMMNKRDDNIERIGSHDADIEFFDKFLRSRHQDIQPVTRRCGECDAIITLDEYIVHKHISTEDALFDFKYSRFLVCKMCSKKINDGTFAQKKFLPETDSNGQ